MDKSPKKILIAEDDLIISMVLERMASRMNHIIVGTATTGKDVIRAAEEMSPDLILMDIQLNDDVDGIEAVKEIQKKAPISVIYITGNLDRYSLERVNETEYVEYMVKPIQMENLEKAIFKAFH